VTLVDTQVAAVAVGVTRRTVQLWVAKGLLANHGTARRIRVDLNELARVVA